LVIALDCLGPRVGIDFADNRDFHAAGGAALAAAQLDEGGNRLFQGHCARLV
jgi:hypothetical protein